ncbi:glycine zipper 2TM domain-containing protein [Marinobacterium aestuariivivens]|uniref:Glycine zipper 2TM domain-containing protein n=1 Tax=Marinobacterium aestuariivivens TaxID=1698799 RepID=A0ABW2A3V2_9GAMM
MKLRYGFGSVLALITVLMLGGCETLNNPSYRSDSGTSDYRSSDYGNGYQTTIYSGYGVIQSIELVRQDSGDSGGSGVGMGTIAGAVVGGVVGSQVGSGSGSTAATIIGAAGGAYIGHELENRPQEQTAEVFRVRVRMENGSMQTLLLSNNNPGFRVGDRVRISNGVMERY